MQAHRDDGGEALADVLAGEVLVLVLEDACAAGVVVDGAGERVAEALEMGATVNGVDVVGEGERVLRVALVPLHGDVDLAGLAAALEVDGGGGAHDGLALVEPLGVVEQAVVELEDVLLDLAALLDLTQILEGELEALVEEGRLAQVGLEGVVVELDGLEDLCVGPEGDGGAGGLGLADDLHLAHGLAVFEVHLVDLAVAADLHLDVGGERVDDRDAHAVQAAGDLVAAAAELAARMEHGEDDLEGGDLELGVLVDGDAAAVVLDRAGAVFVDDHVDLVAEAAEGLVNRVVDHLPHEVVQAAGAG